ncbi:MAG: YeeE/YedE family protein [Methyloceanibacter sp.]
MEGKACGKRSRREDQAPFDPPRHDVFYGRRREAHKANRAVRQNAFARRAGGVTVAGCDEAVTQSRPPRRTGKAQPMTATEFTPYASTLGGALIGISAVMLLAINGRIAGISGILARLFPPFAGREPVEAAAIVLGLVAAPLVYAVVAGAPFAQTVSDNAALMAVSGLLVGFGAGVGGGCTSGHGVCGIARLSSRSLAATAIFMATGFATVFAVRHLLG